MRALDQVLPGRANISGIAMIGSLIDDEADIKVTGLIGVTVV